MYVGAGLRAFSTTSHPAMIRYRDRSPLWKTIRFGMVSAMGASSLYAVSEDRDVAGRCSAGRVTAGFQYTGPAMDPELARELIDGKPDVYLPEPGMRSVIVALLATAGEASVRRLAQLSGSSASRVSSVTRDLEGRGHAVKRRLGPAGDLGADRNGSRAVEWFERDRVLAPCAK